MISLALYVVPFALAQNYSGSVCTDSDPTRTALTGKHLRILELEWAPYATKDESAPNGWRGFDIDLLEMRYSADSELQNAKGEVPKVSAEPCRVQ